MYYNQKGDKDLFMIENKQKTAKTMIRDNEMNVRIIQCIFFVT